MRCWRGPFGVTLRQCLREVTLPTSAAVLVAILWHWLDDPLLADDANVATAAGPWLTLPLIVAAFGCSLVAARTWPTFSLRRNGADTVRRASPGVLVGRGAVTLGAVSAQLLLCVPLTIALAAWFHVPETARRHVEARLPAAALLDRSGATLRCTLPAPTRVRALWIRPRASLPTGPRFTKIGVASDGVALSDEPAEFEESLQLVRLDVGDRELRSLTLTQLEGDVPLLFHPGSVVAVEAAQHPRWANAAVLSIIAAATTVFALVIGALLGLSAGWPTVAGAIAVAQFVQWLGGVGPVESAVLCLTRGQWLL